MHAQLARIVEQLEQAQARLHNLGHWVPEERWNQRTNPESWSVGECVAHLNLTSRAYVPLIRDALASGRAAGGPAPARYRSDPVGWLLALSTGPLPRLGPLRFGRMRTAPAFVPAGDRPRAELLAEFDRLQAEMIGLVREADGLPLGRLTITSPFDARVRYNLYSGFRLIPRHQLRHLEQAERVWPSAARGS